MINLLKFLENVFDILILRLLVRVLLKTYYTPKERFIPPAPFLSERYFREEELKTILIEITVCLLKICPWIVLTFKVVYYCCTEIGILGILDFLLWFVTPELPYGDSTEIPQTEVLQFVSGDEPSKFSTEGFDDIVNYVDVTEPPEIKEPPVMSSTMLYIVFFFATVISFCFACYNLDDDDDYDF